MRTMQSSVDRKRKHRERMRRWRQRRAEKHIAKHRDEPVRQNMRDLHVYTITVHNRLANTTHTFDLLVSRKRINSYKIIKNGNTWKQQMSMTQFTTALRKAMPPIKIIHD